MSTLEISYIYSIVDEYGGVKLHWKLSMSPDYHGQVPRVTCPSCNGHCRGHAGFGFMDDPEDCHRCHNTGTIDDPRYTDYTGGGPRPPKELQQRLEKVWKDYWNEQQNENFVLK